MASTEPNPYRRTRTDEDSTEVTQDPELWLPDGNIVVITLRVHQSIVARHSLQSNSHVPPDRSGDLLRHNFSYFYDEAAPFNLLASRVRVSYEYNIEDSSNTHTPRKALPCPPPTNPGSSQAGPHA
ncbi:hypothetical protein C8Q76DRAFT_801031 [Earliella scabrosa]|nr:hypothetical protein C8Q76DRAFT_801031 [Earliella scabrosa]